MIRPHRGDFRELRAAVPIPIIEDARPMSRKQRRLAARRKR